ncbi:MAG: cell division protein ZapA [Muribaculaceae bacterium]|nr:cell division protein ZapA [Muribaculaceae bacterium]
MNPDRIINISIRIADQPRIPLRIPAHQEETVRRAEENINALWQAWKAKEEFSDKSPAEILAMVTFRFAQLYYSNLEASQNIDKVLAGLESSFDDLLLEDVRP